MIPPLSYCAVALLRQASAKTRHNEITIIDYRTCQVDQIKKDK